jgi:hypothetical protein
VGISRWAIEVTEGPCGEEKRGWGKFGGSKDPLQEHWLVAIHHEHQDHGEGHQTGY